MIADKNFTNLLKKAQAFHKKKEYEKAIRCLKRLVELKPDYYEGWMLLGITYSIIKDYDQATEFFMKTIELKNDSFEGYKNLGKNLYLSNKEPDATICSLLRAITLNPDDKQSYFYLSQLYLSQEKYNESIKLLTILTNIKPDDPEAYIYLSQIHMSKNNYIEALRLLNIIIKLKPDHVDSHYKMGTIFSLSCDYDKAMECYKKVLEIDPSHKNAYQRMGTIFSQINNFEEGMKSYQKALELGGDEIDIYGDMAATLLYNNMIDEAVKYFEKVIEKDPENPRILCAYGQTFLIKGKLNEGLKYYEHRLFKKNPHAQKEIYTKIKTPHWNGEPIKGKTIYTYHEQGYGDTIQFARFIPQLVSMGANVIFKPQPQFYDLFLENNLGAKIIKHDIPESEIEYDTHISIMSLPYYLKTSIDTIPYSEGYLKANPEKVKQYKEKYFSELQKKSESTSFLKIGIAWQGGAFGLTNRNIPLEKFFDLAKIPNVKLYSLQKGVGIDEKLNNLPDGIEIVNLGKTFNDFSDTTAALENLDLVIMSDTSVVHLAGALSKSTWLLLPYGSEWRWFLDREDSPWYKSLKLFRQTELNEWNSVFDRVITELKVL